ncbi:hypothetical protein STEG23_019289 [Scotinomys teguina]
MLGRRRTLEEAPTVASSCSAEPGLVASSHSRKHKKVSATRHSQQRKRTTGEDVPMPLGAVGTQLSQKAQHLSFGTAITAASQTCEEKTAGVLDLYARVLDLYAGVLDLYAGVLDLYAGALDLYAGVLGLYAGVLGLYAGVLDLYAGLLDLYAGVLDLYAGALGLYVGVLDLYAGLLDLYAATCYNWEENAKDDPALCN